MDSKIDYANATEAPTHNLILLTNWTFDDNLACSGAEVDEDHEYLPCLLKKIRKVNSM